VAAQPFGCRTSLPACRTCQKACSYAREASPRSVQPSPRTHKHAASHARMSTKQPMTQRMAHVSTHSSFRHASWVRVSAVLLHEGGLLCSVTNWYRRAHGRISLAASGSGCFRSPYQRISACASALHRGAATCAAPRGARRQKAPRSALQYPQWKEDDADEEHCNQQHW